MKRCPRCNSLFEDTVQFCLNDGTPLVAESFSLPSDEEETIIRHEPITINIPPPNEFSPVATTPSPIPENAVVVPADKPSLTGNYALFLIVGLLLGGGLVLLTLLLSRNYFQTTTTTNVNLSQPANVVKIKPSPVVVDNKNTVPDNDSETASAKHAAPNEDANDGLFNGRVIAANARVRRDPSANAPVVDVLPAGDRLDIIDRAAAHSPWYQVECEHGTTGWMHGDTIEFTKGNF